MTYSRYEKLSLGSIEAKGWLKKQLELQKNGLTGKLEEYWSDVGIDNGWKGGKGESWERGPYYLDGMVALAYTLKDKELIEKARVWIEWTLKSQTPDGLFGPLTINTVNEDVNKEQDWWHYMIMLKVMMQYYEASDDKRVIIFLDKFLSYVSENLEDMPLRGWAKTRGSEMLLCVNWISKHVDRVYLKKLADLLITQTTDWTSLFNDFPFWRKVEKWDWTSHVVNVAMGLKMPGIIYECTGNAKELDSIKKGISELMKYHGQAHGMFSGDEWLSGTSPAQGIELCAIVEYMFTLEELIRIYGTSYFGDILEKVAFNALPASISPDWMSHQYDQQVNQVMCNVAKRPWSNGPDANIFGLEPHFGCCTSNMHQGWPKFTSSIVMKEKRGGYYFNSYVPSKISDKTVKDNTLIMEIFGDYPFREEIKIKINIDCSERFSLFFRKPMWCKEVSLSVNEEKVIYSESDGVIEVNRLWDDEDRIQIVLPMEVHMKTRNMYGVSIERGPLVYALPIEEDWRMIRKRDFFNDYEIYPKSQWQYGVLENTDFKVVYNEMKKQPFDCDAPIEIRVKGKFIPDWSMENSSAAQPQLVADDPLIPCEEITLIPYGCTNLRIGEIPSLRKHEY